MAAPARIEEFTGEVWNKCESEPDPSVPRTNAGILASVPLDASCEVRALLDKHLHEVNAALAMVRRRKRLRIEEYEELRSLVYLKLVEREGAALLKFRGDSSVRTYLAVVVKRVLLDSRNARYGKWRPSARARRLGQVATCLDQLVNRDGLPLSEAARIVRSRFNVMDTDDELAVLLASLPRRSSRTFVSIDAVEGQASSGPPPDASLLRLPLQDTRRELARALAALPASERALLRARFGEGRRVCEVARTARTDPKAMYRTFDRILAGLRRRLEQRGVLNGSLEV